MLLPPGPTCRCGQPATLQWQRRATAAEWDAEVARCRGKAAEFGYEPDALVPKDGLALQIVFGCQEHALPADLAAGLHSDTCTGCDCTPTLPESAS